jgi:hypothetical protein
MLNKRKKLQKLDTQQYNEEFDLEFDYQYDLEFDNQYNLEYQEDIKSKELSFSLENSISNRIQLIKFDIEFCKSDDITFDLYGGGPNDRFDILYYISNLLNNNIISKNSSDKNQYHFVVSNREYNKKESNNSIYINNGFVSTVIAIECLHPYHIHIEDGQREKLVLKLLLIKKDKDKKYYDEWNYRYYKIYEENKLLYNNLLAKCYYYGNNVNVANSNLDMDQSENGIKLKEVFKDKKLVFNIFKYYDLTVDDIEIKKTILLKLISVLYFCKRNNVYIGDLKYQNIGFDKHNNIVLIDYAEFLFTTYIINHQYILWKQTTLTSMSACYLKKQFYLISGLDNPDTHLYIEKQLNKMQTKIFNSDEEINKMIKINIIYYNLLKQNTIAIDYNKYYTINFIPLFDKINSIAIINILLFLFFEEIEMMASLLYFDDLFEYNKIKLKLNKKICTIYRSSIINHICSFQNINDIKILNIFVNWMLIPLGGIDPEFIAGIRKLIFDPETETGLFAPDYEDVPDYELVLKYLKELTKNVESIYSLLKRLLDENIGTDAVKSKIPLAYQTELNDHFKIKYVGEDVLAELGLNFKTYDQITYEEWAEARRIEKLKDRPINRTGMNLKLPPKNSRFPQNIHSIDNSQQKWIEHEDGTWTINQLPEQLAEKLKIKITPEQLEKITRLFDGYIKTGYTQPGKRVFSSEEKENISKYIDATSKLTQITYENIPLIIKDISETIQKSFTQEQIKYIIEILNKYIMRPAVYVIPHRRKLPLAQNNRSQLVNYKYLKYKDKYLKLKSELNI